MLGQLSDAAQDEILQPSLCSASESRQPLHCQLPGCPRLTGQPSPHKPINPPLCFGLQVIPVIMQMREEEERRAKAAERVQRKLGVQLAEAAAAAAAVAAPASGSGGSGAVAGAVRGGGAAGPRLDGGREPGGRCVQLLLGGLWGTCCRVARVGPGLLPADLLLAAPHPMPRCQLPTGLPLQPCCALHPLSPLNPHPPTHLSRTHRSRRARQRVNYAFNDYDETLRSGGWVAVRTCVCDVV
jgi:hypothetical protein